ncbi:murein biosynthesis integral membrane protein MurJ [Pontiellaceae bacterium B12219]|nr:murein biosynthesis integral membrane protein MurJ [Pontiellaceae bacterium B12219]
MKNSKVIRSAGVVGSFTLLSRGLGMLRDIIIAYYFGTSLLASAFFVAFTIPNLFRRLFGEGALSAAFIPIFIETRTKQGDRDAWDMAAKVITMTAALLSVIAIIGVLIFSIGMHLPCFSEKWVITFSLSRLMFPYVVFICLAALSMAVLNSFRHFATSAFAPCLLNLILIIIMLVLFPIIGKEPMAQATLLAWGVVIAGIAQVAIQLPALKRFGCPFRFSSQWNDPKIRQMLMLMGPAALGMAVTQFNVLIDRLLALWIGDWAPAAMFYSERMIYFPLGIIATAMGTVLLPTFSSHAAEDDHSAMSSTINHSLRQLSFIMLPAAMGLFVLAPNILSAIFEWGGNFNDNSTLLSARALMFYAPGLVVFSAAKVFVPAFYAMKDTRTPVRIGIYTVLLNLFMNIILILILPEYWKHAGMAFSTVMSEALGMTALGILLSRRVENIQWKTIGQSLLRHAISAVAMALIVWMTATVMLPILGKSVSSKFAQIGTVGLSMAVGAFTYFICTLALKVPELREIKSALNRR